jgi:hypothetical protein
MLSGSDALLVYSGIGMNAKNPWKAMLEPSTSHSGAMKKPRWLCDDLPMTISEILKKK